VIARNVMVELPFLPLPAFAVLLAATLLADFV
jgi:hypothetical protein